MASDKTIAVAGVHAVQQLLSARPERVLQFYVRKTQQLSPRLQMVVDSAREHGLSVQFVPNDTLDSLADGQSHQGVLAVCRLASAAQLDLDALCAERGEQLLLLVLDGVEDPHNLGACLRSAAAAGVDAVVIPDRRAVGLNATVQKVACGGADVVPVCVVKNLARTLKQLQKAGVWIVGAAAEAEQSIHDIDMTSAIAIVMGGEENGLRKLTREHCDYIASIPANPNFSSLNVSVATGVLLFEAVRQRLNS